MTAKPMAVKMLLAALLLLASAGFSADPAAKPHMMYFYNPSCRLCTGTNEVVGEVEAKYDGQLSHQRFNIADNETGIDNVLYMFDLLDEMGVPEENTITLVVFLGLLEEEDGELFFTPKRVLVEGEDIMAKLDSEIADFLANEGKGGLTLGHSRLASFFSQGIGSHNALASIPPADDPAAIDPAASDDGTEGEAPIRPRIRRTNDGDGEGVSSRADSRLRFGAITLAALADSINPCAFATIIILVAMMSSAKRTKREIIAVCLAFTAAVFITYFAIGLFLHTVIAQINQRGGWFLVAADLIYYLAFALCVIFAILSLRDAIVMFQGKKAEEMVLQLPKAFKKRINVAMARGVHATWLVAGVFIAGITVSFLEAACTGQVYLPTIITLAKLSFWQSMLLLTWYNLLFIAPLLLIFLLVLLGTTSSQLADFFQKHVAWIRLALALVFIVMGVILWYEMYWPPGYRG